jgi:D-arabinose 1-dehydrogenase-like Zn-dependent alcohol dehydrogenase
LLITEPATHHPYHQEAVPEFEKIHGQLASSLKSSESVMAVNQSMRGVDGKVLFTTNPPRELQSKEVLIKITHSGLCASDLAYLQYGCVLGHEGIGIIEQVGSEVTKLKVGDRVGGGYLRSVC